MLEKKLKLYVTAVKKNIDDHLTTAKEKLKKSLVETVRQNPPATWKKFMDGSNLSQEEAERLLDEVLDRAFAGKGLEKHFGKVRAEKLFSEHDAAPENQTSFTARV